MDQFYFLWKPDMRARREILPVGTNFAVGGHVSVYNFDDRTAKAIGFKSNEVIKREAVWHSKDLIIDIDDPDHIPDVRNKLKSKKLGYEMYTTGGKGAHFHVPRTNLPSNHLPYSDLTWLQTNEISTDPMIYTLFHTIRNKGAIHEKTSKPKILVETYQSDTEFSVPLIETPQKFINTNMEYSSSDSIFSDTALLYALNGYSAGNRYQGMMWVAQRLLRFKLTDPQAYFILDQVAKACVPQFEKLQDVWRFYTGAKNDIKTPPG